VIKQVLTHDYLATRAGWLSTQLADGDAEPPQADLPEGEPPSREELEAVREMLMRAAEQGPDAHLAEEHPPPPLDGGETLPDLANVAYFARDGFTSLLQSALEAYFDEHAPGIVEEPPEPIGQGLAPDEAPLPDPVTDRSLAVADEQDQLFGAYEITDPGWVNSIIAMGWRSLRKPHPFKAERPRPRPLAPDARLVLVADWGSGIPRARNVADAMRRIIEPDIGRREQHVIHLGDVYYSGWKREYDRNFLAYWPVAPGEPVSSWSLNGNHDMYSGGHAYFGHLLQDPRFAEHDGSSWFSLENDDWQLLGLDTAYDDHALKDPQGAWVAEKLRSNPDRRTVLLSHHQLFSAYGSDGPKLRDKLRDPLDSGRIDAWFWGHEHRCVLYEDGYQNVGKARLIGHGGVPVYAHHEPIASPARYQLTRSFATGWEEWALMGFAVVELSGRHANVRYLDEWGNEIEEIAETL
jgi:hypothetical protein